MVTKTGIERKMVTKPQREMVTKSGIESGYKKMVTKSRYLIQVK